MRTYDGPGLVAPQQVAPLNLLHLQQKMAAAGAAGSTPSSACASSANSMQTLPTPNTAGLNNTPMSDIGYGGMTFAGLNGSISSIGSVGGRTVPAAAATLASPPHPLADKMGVTSPTTSAAPPQQQQLLLAAGIRQLQQQRQQQQQQQQAQSTPQQQQQMMCIPNGSGGYMQLPQAMLNSIASPQSPAVASPGFGSPFLGTPQQQQQRLALLRAQLAARGVGLPTEGKISPNDPPGTRYVQVHGSTLKNTPSTSPAFIWDGWLYPAGLNRKERRAIMFAGGQAPQVNPRKLNERLWVGKETPNGPVSEADATALAAAEPSTPASESLVNSSQPTPTGASLDDSAEDLARVEDEDCLPPLMDGDDC